MLSRLYNRDMSKSEACPSCSASWPSGGHTCTEAFNKILAWELDHKLYDVHHLLVLCFHIQHPELYSPEALIWALRALVEFLNTDLTPAELRQRAGHQFNPATRTHRIQGTPESHGSYKNPPDWSIHITDVVAGGLESYYASINSWSLSIYKDLLMAGNLPLD